MNPAIPLLVMARATVVPHAPSCVLPPGTAWIGDEDLPVEAPRATHENRKRQSDDQGELQPPAQDRAAERAPLGSIGGSGLPHLLAPLSLPFLLRFALEPLELYRDPIHMDKSTGVRCARSQSKPVS